jgi:hypothetical protein
MTKGHFIAWTTVLAMVAILLATGCSKPKEFKPSPLDVVVPNLSVGKVRKGMTRPEVEDTIGKPKKKDKATSYYKGMWVRFNTNGVLFNVKCAKGFEGHTQEGIGIGSTHDEVTNAYGKPDGDKLYEHGDEDLWFSSLNINFWVQRGKVTSFIVHFFPGYLMEKAKTSSPLTMNPPSSAEQLRAEAESALKAKNTNAFLALFNWEGVPENLRFKLDDETAELFTHESITAVKLIALPADLQPTNEVDGVRYKPNIPVVGMIDIEFPEQGNAMQLPYGSSSNHFYLANTIKEKIATPATKAKSLNISVEGPATPDAAMFTGSYVYVKDGKEIKEAISGKGNLSQAFWGDYVKSCAVKRTSDKGWIRLKILEDGKVVYSSAIEETQKPIKYERQ